MRPFDRPPLSDAETIADLRERLAAAEAECGNLAKQLRYQRERADRLESIAQRAVALYDKLDAAVAEAVRA